MTSKKLSNSQNCCICGNAGIRNPELLTIDANIGSRWKEESTELFSRLLCSSTNNELIKRMLVHMNFCGSCDIRMRDMYLSFQMMDKLRNRMTDSVMTTARKLISNHNLLLQKTDLDCLIEGDCEHKCLKYLVDEINSDGLLERTPQDIQALIFHKLADIRTDQVRGNFWTSDKESCINEPIVPKPIQPGASNSQKIAYRQENDKIHVTDETRVNRQKQDYFSSRTETKYLQFSLDIEAQESKIRLKKDQKQKESTETEIKTAKDVQGVIPESRKSNFKFRNQGTHPWSCRIGKCMLHCMTKEALRGHQQKEHMGIPKPFACPSCKQRFSNLYRMNIHIACVHGGKKYSEKQKTHQCKICSKFCYTKPLVEHHMKKVHKAMEDHTCHMCKRYFTSQLEVDAHVKQFHKGRRLFSCSNCRLLVFPTQASLQIHEETFHRL